MNDESIKLTPAHERWLLLTLAAIQFTHIVDFMIMMPLGTYLMRLFHINTTQFSLLVSAYTFSAGICGFLSAFFIDRFDRKHVLQFFFGGFMLGTLACALAPSYEFLLAARILAGSFGGVLAALINSVVGDAIPMERRGTAMGIVTASFSVASVFGVPLGLYLASQFSWHAPFLFLVAVSIGVMAMIMRNVPALRGHIHADKPRPKPFEILRQAVLSPAQRQALMLTTFMMLGQFSIVPFIAPSMVANVGFGEDQIFLLYLIGGLTTMVTGPLIGRLADKIGKLQVLMIFLVLSIGPQLLVTHLGPMPIMLALLATTSFFIVSGGRMIPAMALITGAVEPRYRGSFMSIQSALQQIAAGVASMIAGRIVFRDAAGHLQHFGWVGWVSVVSSLICMLVAWQMARSTRVPSPTPTPEPRLSQA